MGPGAESAITEELMEIVEYDGDFQGCRPRFVQLPFEVSSGDNLLFNLLDDDELSTEDEQRIVTTCRATGYGVLIADSVYAPRSPGS